MKFKKIVDQQTTHQQLHIGGILGPEDYYVLLYQYCYLIKDQLKQDEFDRFQKILQQIELRAIGYFGQILYIFNKLAKLFFEKDKPHNPFLVARVRVLIVILKYDNEPEIDIATDIFQISILLKRSRFFTSAHTD